MDDLEREALRQEMAVLAERNYVKLKRMSAVLERLTEENSQLREENLRLRKLLEEPHTPPKKLPHLTLVSSKYTEQ